MARRPEQRLWDRMRTNLKGSGIWLQRMENVVGTGRPDVDAAYLGTFTAVELKQVEAFPVRAATRVLGDKGLNQDQLNWWIEFNKHGGRGIILVGVGSHEVYGFDGSLSEQVNQLTTQQFQQAARLLNWNEVRAHLRGYK